MFSSRDSEAFVTFKFKESEYMGLKRVRLFTMIDFCSYVGGLLGLFAGFSVLSFCEFFYFFTVRVFLNLLLNKRRKGRRIIKIEPRTNRSTETIEARTNSNLDRRFPRLDHDLLFPSCTWSNDDNDHSRPFPNAFVPAVSWVRPESELFGALVETS